MILIDEFSEELIVSIERIFEQKQADGALDWRTILRNTVRLLTEKLNCRSRGASFIIGDESSSTSASNNELFIDAEVQVDLNQFGAQEKQNQVLYPHLPAAASSMSTSNERREEKMDRDLDNTMQQVTVKEEDGLLLAEMREGRLKHRMLEQRCSPHKAVELRRLHIEERHRIHLQNLPHGNYDYTEVKDACCENVIGFIPLPTGVAGPLHFDGQLVPIPLSTTEGALVASVSRGCLCINESIKQLGREDGLFVDVLRDGMSRAPVLEFERISEASKCFRWIQKEETFYQLKRSFDETSSYACLLRIEPHLEGNYLYLRFVATTGDAMGMNMVTKGTGRAITIIKREFPQMRMVSISGNFCVDKKSSAINWLQGRGKTVIAETFVPAQIVERVLRTNVDKMVKLADAKLMVGSSASITIGGWNAHAANVVAAMFLATGQDAAQVVSSSMCLTQMSKRQTDGALHVTCTMNCLEVGTIGGGTVLTPQSTCLEMLGCRRIGQIPGENAKRLARLVCATVMAGELSLLASQCTEGDLERSHLKLNRSSRNLLVTSGSAFTLASPNHLCGPYSASASPCKRSVSTIGISIPEDPPLEPPEPKFNLDELDPNLNQERIRRDRKKSNLLTQGAKLLKKSTGRCEPL